MNAEWSQRDQDRDIAQVFVLASSQNQQ